MRVLHSLLLLLTVAELLPGLAALLLPGWIPALLGIFSLWLLAPAWLLLAAALLLRRRLLVALSAPVALAHLALLAADRWPAPPPPPPDAPQLHVVSANLLMVHPDPLPLAQALLARDADVLLLQEVSGRWVAALEESGLLAAYPHQLVLPQEDSFGIALLSRVPLRAVGEGDLLGVPYTHAVLQLGETTVTLLNIHTLPPRTGAYFERWQAQLDLLAELSRAQTGAVALIGDLNTTQHGRAYRRLLRASGLHAAHPECGRGSAVTFPNGVFPLPPIRLDHALLSPALACVSLTEIPRTGSDHSALDMVLALRTPSSG